MKKAVVYEVDECASCVHCWKFINSCIFYGFVDDKKIDDIYSIPDWCPLDDWVEDMPEIDQEGS